MALPTDVRLSFNFCVYALQHALYSISTTGASEYRLNGAVVTYTAYAAALAQHNVLVQARNFLVFQGDVEAVASQSSKALTRLVEQVSGSLALAPDYERAKAAQAAATDAATISFTRRRGVAGEIRAFREQKGDAERFEDLCNERASDIRSLLFEPLFYARRG